MTVHEHYLGGVGCAPLITTLVTKDASGNQSPITMATPVFAIGATATIPGTAASPTAYSPRSANPLQADGTGGASVREPLGATAQYIIDTIANW